jgi:hypothetical protein
MSRVRPQRNKCLRALNALLLAASGVFATCAAHAQESSALRGAVTQEETNAYLLRRTGSTSNPQTTGATGAPAYQPVSPGAVPDEPATSTAAGSSLFDDLVAEPSPFEDPPIPAPRQTSTARERAEEARERAAGEPETTEENPNIDEDTGGVVRVSPVESVAEDEPLDEGADRAEAIEGLDKRPDDRPFDAPGIRLGTFILKPTLEEGVTATDNADSSTNGSPGVLSETVLRLNAVSDWSNHRATIDAYGIFRKSISGADTEDLSAGVDAALEIDITEEFRARATLGYAIRPESAASPVIIVGAASEPLRQILVGSLGLEKDVGKARFAVTGIVDRNTFGDAELEGGGMLSQEERNSTLYLAELRAGYEISPAITPFVAAELGRRIYDLEVDTAGFARSSDRIGARAGVAIDLREKLTGEFSAGWLRETFDDDRLATVSGPSVQANINWSPERGTTVSLFGQTVVEGTTTAGESGSILYLSRLSVDREIRSNLTGNLVLGAAWRDYVGTDGHDLILNAEAGLTWWLSRYAGLTGRVRHEQVESNLPDRDSKTNSVFLGLKLQR